MRAPGLCLDAGALIAVERGSAEVTRLCRRVVERGRSLHVVPEVVAPSSAYLYVGDADDLASRWSSAGVAVHPPLDTPWGMHEGAVVDPDHNVIRFGHPV